MLNRLYANWVYGGVLAGLLLLALSPLLTRGWPPALVCTFLCLPAYMFHQYEEHENDRFRGYVNKLLGPGRRGLTLRDVFVINIFGIWVAFAVVLWLAVRVHPGFGLIAIYGLLVNAVVHIVAAIVKRSYNPGVATSVLLFLPLGGYGWWLFHPGAGGYFAVDTFYDAFGLGATIALHVVIVAWGTRPATASQ
jgi:hypothetical protein